MTRKSKTPRQTVAAKTKSFEKAFAPHPRQQDFMDAAVALRAQDLASAVAPPLTPQQALATARDEFEADLDGILFPTPNARFYFIWRSASQARTLTRYTQAVWKQSPGIYGDREPIHYEARPMASRASHSKPEFKN